VKLPLVTLFDNMWGKRCHQFDDGTRQIMKIAYQEALTDNACSNLNLLQLQKEAGYEILRTPRLISTVKEVSLH